MGKMILRGFGFAFGLVWVAVHFWVLMAISSGLDQTMIDFMGR